MIERQMHEGEASMNSDVFGLAVGCAGLGVWQIFPASGTWLCSPLCKRLLGIAEDGDPATVLSSEDRKRSAEALDRAMRVGEYRFEFRAKDRWLSATGGVVRDGCAPAIIVGTLQDVTAQKLELE